MFNLETLRSSLTNPESVVNWLESLHGEGVKWKHSANSNQIILRTDDYYYKAYAFNEVDKFNSLIRHAFAEVYRSYGIDWEIITIQTERGFLDIERREILDVCEEWSDDILINYSDTLRRVEEKLCLCDIVKQIQTQYKFVSKLKLMRHCVNKAVDYAVYKDRIILLDDADWFLYMLDDRNVPISTKNMFVKVSLFEEDYTLTQWLINPQKSVTVNRIYDINDKFFLFKRLDLIKRDASIRNDFQKMLSNNVALLTSNDDDTFILEERASFYSPFKKPFYCTNTLEGIDFSTHNKVVVRQSDVLKDKRLWDDICYEYVNKNLCSVNLHTSFYDESLYELCELLNQTKLCSIEPINGFPHTGVTLCVQWNILKDNSLWEENFKYIRQHYPSVKIIVAVVLNEPFLQSVLRGDIDLRTFKDDCDANILYGSCDDTPTEYLPRRKSMLLFLTEYECLISGRIYRSETTFNDDIKSCGHSKSGCLSYYDNDKCSICDLRAIKFSV